jgi:peptide subunit release factor RF-3
MIRNLKERAEKLQKQLVKVRSQGANEVSERSEMEQLFIECIEEVRKEVMRRRFRNEITNQKNNPTSTNVATIKRLGNARLSKTSIEKNAQSQTIAPNVMSDSEARDFEESLYKLA